MYTEEEKEERRMIRLHKKLEKFTKTAPERTPELIREIMSKKIFRMCDNCNIVYPKQYTDCVCMNKLREMDRSIYAV